MEDISTIAITVPSGAASLFVEPGLRPIDSFDLGVLGNNAPYATTSGVESVTCAHSMIATG